MQEWLIKPQIEQNQESESTFTKNNFIMLYISYFAVIITIMYNLWCYIVHLDEMSIQMCITVLLQFATCFFIYLAIQDRKTIYLKFTLILCFIWYFTVPSELDQVCYPVYIACFAFVVISVTCILQNQSNQGRGIFYKKKVYTNSIKNQQTMSKDQRMSNQAANLAPAPFMNDD